MRHGPIDAIDPDRKPFDGEGVPPAKECPQCMTIIHAACRVCPICGYVFPLSEVYVNTTPVNAPVLKSQIEPEEIIVTYTDYSIHTKEGKKNSVKITYSHAMGSVNEWVFPETTTQWGDFYYRKLCKEMGLSEPYPRTAEDFVYRPDLRAAARVWTIPDGKYERVKKREWGGLREVFADDVPF
jgi:DNA repair protein RadD